jgi:molybdate transport system permease protein
MVSKTLVNKPAKGREGSGRFIIRLLFWTWLLFILSPFLALFLRLDWSYLPVLRESPLALRALTISFATTSISLLAMILVGLPAAWFLAKSRGNWSRMASSLLDLPMVLPPSVAGVLLLLAFGRHGLIGSYLAQKGILITFTWVAVVVAQCFVAGPFFIKSAITGFQGVDPELEATSLTLGKSRWQTFWRVTFPLALPSIVSGLVMAWARALGEFGATIIFAGNLPGRTQTLPLAIYMAMENDFPLAMALAALMVFISFCLLGLIKLLERWKAGGWEHA